MSTISSQFGLSPVKPKGGQVTIQQDWYYIPYTVANNLFVGDPVIKTGGANTLSNLNGQNIVAGYYPLIEKTTAGSTNLSTGVITGFQSIPLQFTGTSLYFQTGGSSSASDRLAIVADDAFQKFMIRDDGVVTLTAATVALNANLIYTDTGDTVNFISGAQLNSSTVGTGATLQLKILRFMGWDLGNPVGNPSGIWQVMFNLHTELPNTVGIS